MCLKCRAESIATALTGEGSSALKHGQGLGAGGGQTRTASQSTTPQVRRLDQLDRARHVEPFLAWARQWP